MKLTILGAGNAGCVSLLHFSYFRKFLKKSFEIEIIYDKNIDPVSVGQGTNLIVSELIWKSLGINILSKNSFSFTQKNGILYENWGKKQKEFFHPFPYGSYAFHQDPVEFQKFVLENIKDISIKDTGLKNYNDIDSDFIIDCTGTPKNFEKYEKLINPLNHVLLSTLPKADYQYTKTTATPDGWCFEIPLKDKVSIGYNFNSDITSIKNAEKNFKKIFNIKKINKNFEYKQYVAKEPIIDNRIALNGNKLFFLEPLEATAIGSYIIVCRFLWDWLFEKTSTKEQTILNIKEYMIKIQNFILWHYANGSKYNTKFWNYSNKLYKKNKSNDFEKYVNLAKINTYDYLRNPNFNKEYAQWPSWSIKMWNDYVS